ncbi:MAG: hypothetical protein QM709_16080 [Spongiibacteraceae bacterium]
MSLLTLLGVVIGCCLSVAAEVASGWICSFGRVNRTKRPVEVLIRLNIMRNLKKKIEKSSKKIRRRLFEKATNLFAKIQI